MLVQGRGMGRFRSVGVCLPLQVLGRTPGASAGPAPPSPCAPPASPRAPRPPCPLQLPAPHMPLEPPRAP